MEIRRFGVGHRRSEGPQGTVGVAAAPIHSDKLGVIAELALRPKASIAPHTNPNLAYLVVIEGGGFVSVGDETVRVAAGEAVVWPPDVVHAAWTEATSMRAIVVEFAADAGLAEPLLLDAAVAVIPPEPQVDPSLEPGSGSGLVGEVKPPASRPIDRRGPADDEPW
jgi:quercetin dioxygenase-like cupin family protein